MHTTNLGQGVARFNSQLDKDPKHAATGVFYIHVRTKHVSVLEWPRLNSDIKPVENLWD